ncbi:hypothetical protein TNCT_665551, partial [Trichonephila clavata]
DVRSRHFHPHAREEKAFIHVAKQIPSFTVCKHISVAKISGIGYKAVIRVHFG